MKKISEETREKMRKSALGKKKSLDHRQNISNSLQGKNHPMWGKKVSDIVKLKISESNKGKKRSLETRKKMSIAHSRHYKLVSPERTIHYFNSSQLRKFCETKGFNKGALVNACATNRKYKGWTILRITL